MRKSIVTKAVILAGLLVAPAAAGAQSAPAPQRGAGQSPESQLIQLAHLLGTMQLLRSLCDPADGAFWRERMQEMLRLEKPSVEQRTELINEFNAGYQEASTKFATCTPEAKSLVAETAREAEKLAETLSDSISAPG